MSAKGEFGEPWRWGAGWNPETLADYADPIEECRGEKYADLALTRADGTEIIPLGVDHYDVIVDAHKSSEMIPTRDRERIVACVNALDGLDPAALPALIEATQECLLTLTGSGQRTISSKLRSALAAFGVKP